MTKARIFKTYKSTMQSGRGKEKNWQLEFYPESKPFIYKIMGWTGSSDVNQEICLKFKTLDTAVSFANKYGIDYIIEKPIKEKIEQFSKCYADNFRHK